MPTISVENYLKAVHHLEDGGERVKTKSLAERLGISQPSVTSMLKSLADDGLIDYQPYQGARLTDAGRRAALKVVRNHRLIEVFLVRTLGYRWDEVHAEAERLEHAISDTLADRIDAYLGHPRFDPHGDPIPTADGRLDRRSTRTLVDVEPPSSVRITRVLDQQPDVLRYLKEVGVTPDVTASVVRVVPFDGPVVLRIDDDDDEILLSRALAARVLVADL